MHNVVTPPPLHIPQQNKAKNTRYQKSRDLVQVGAYMSGSDPQLDEAIRLQPAMASFLQQSMFEGATMDDSLNTMAAVLAQ